MINQLAHLNWISVAIGLVVYSVTGALWFTKLFGKSYKVSLGKANQDLNNSSPIFIVGPAICSLVITIVSAILIYALNITQLQGALEFAAVIGIGYLVANTVIIAINPNIPRPMLYSAISGSYHLVCIFIVSIVLVLMR